jgi:hypothetical protein
MALRHDEIRVGAVAYFEPAALLANSDVIRPAVPIDRTGPFVCIQAGDARSAWTPITTQSRAGRLEIETAWRIRGSVQWRTDPMFLSDGASTYIGPDDIFVAAAANDAPFTPIQRPRVTADGVAASLKEVADRKGRLLSAERRSREEQP